MLAENYDTFVTLQSGDDNMTTQAGSTGLHGNRGHPGHDSFGYPLHQTAITLRRHPLPDHCRPAHRHPEGTEAYGLDGRPGRRSG